MNKFGPKMVQFIAAQLILALHHFHTHNIIYRDMKLENILVDKDGYILLADFGLCKLLPPSSRTDTMCGTPDYMAPEVACENEYTNAVDWWGLGVIMFELTVGVTPFAGPNIAVVLDNIVSKTVNYPPFFDQPLRIIIDALLAKNPKKRLQDVTEMKKYTFFKNLDWEKLLVKKLKPPYNIWERSLSLKSEGTRSSVSSAPIVETIGAQSGEDVYLDNFDYTNNLV